MTPPMSPLYHKNDFFYVFRPNSPHAVFNPFPASLPACNAFLFLFRSILEAKISPSCCTNYFITMFSRDHDWNFFFSTNHVRPPVSQDPLFSQMSRSLLFIYFSNARHLYTNHPCFDQARQRAGSQFQTICNELRLPPYMLDAWR